MVLNNQKLIFPLWMKTMIKGLLFVLLFNIHSVTVAQPEDVNQKIENYKKKKEYNYFKQKQKEEEKQDERSNYEGFSLPSFFGDFFMVIIVGLFVVVVGVVAYTIIKNGDFNAAKEKELGVSEKYENLNEEDINSNDFDDLIQRAKDAEDYRLVLRLMFLKSLQLLDSKKIINYDKNKTNYEYSSEMKKGVIKNNFLKVSDSFAWIWYGNKSINELTYKQLYPDFDQLIERIGK